MKIISNHCDVPPCHLTELKKQINKIQKEKNELKQERNDLIERVEELKIDMINHTKQNYDEWKKEAESDAIGLIRLDLQRAEEENEELKGEVERLEEQYSKAVQDINQRDFERISLLSEIKELKRN